MTKLTHKGHDYAVQLDADNRLVRAYRIVAGRWNDLALNLPVVADLQSAARGTA